MMLCTIHELFAGHLRAIVGGMTVEDMLHNREELTANIRVLAGRRPGKLGLVVDSLQIQEIDDESGYITNLGKPQAAAIESDGPDRRRPSATRRPPRPSRPPTPRRPPPCGEQRSRRPATRRRSTRPRPRPRSPARWPRPRPARRSSSPRPQTAELDATLGREVLESEVRKPADAEAYRQVTLANAEREAKIAAAEAKPASTSCAVRRPAGDRVDG